jgi:tetratricopeptide (TPR) repeat protein
MSSADFEPQLRRYVQRPRFQSIVLTLPERVSVEAPDRGRSISAGEAGAWLGDLQRRIGRRSDAAPRIEAAARAAPGASIAALALGLLRLDEGRADEAWPAFESAVAAAPNDFFAQFSYGVSRRRHPAAPAAAPVRQAPAIARACDALTRAAAINPSSSEAFAWLAYAEMMTDGRLREARAAIETAIELAPGRIDYRLRYADIWILEGRIDEATALLTGLAKVKTDKAAVDSATRRLEAIARLRR